MSGTVADATPGPEVEDQTAPCNAQEVKIGLLHADQDINIAGRLRDKIRDCGFQVETCDFLDGGENKLKIVEDFIKSKNLILQLATKTALDDGGLLKTSFEMAQYAAKCMPEIMLRFVTVKPIENLNADLPISLATYTPLIENEFFDRGLKTTVHSVLKKLQRKGTNKRAVPGTASQAAVSGYDDSPRQVPPSSDDPVTITKVPNLHEETVQEEEQIQSDEVKGQVEATPFQTPLDNSSTRLVEEVPQGNGHPVTVVINNTYNIHANDIQSVQMGPLVGQRDCN